ncbi:dihydrolipoyllysine-residue succinyltransferase [Burkholderia pseudomallei]|uniref:dihydrolipoyllysine-residue succinyltransferase n=7 Tax=Bacteria TaxID=2 RepID=UPI0039C61EF2
MTRRAAASAAAVALALASHAAALRAVPLAWPLARFDYRVGPVNAADALGELSRRSGIAIDVDARAPCRLDVREALPPRRFVERLARTCGLVSYYDGAVLQLVAPDAFEHAAVRLNYATLAELRAALARQRIVDARWRPGYDDAARIARVAGPPRYVALVLAAARALDEAAQTRVRTETRAFRLRARAAADRVVRGDGDGDDAVLPGLATRLRGRLEQDGAAPRAVPGVREFTASLPIVDADARSNTVLIRDVPARLARDARLVSQLDTRPASIRIDAFGATLAPAQLDALGLRWRDGAPASGASRDAGVARDGSRASVGVRPVGASRPSGARNEAAAAEARRAPAVSAAPDASGASGPSGPSAASGAPDAVDASAGSADSPRASAVRIAIVSTPAGCAPVRARIAERLLESQQTNAILTTFNEVNMQPVMDLRAKYKDKFEKEHGVKLGFMSFFVKAAVHALKKFPLVNASIDGNDIVYHGYFDIGIAVGSPRGLVVPILRNADQLSLAEIEKKIAEFGQKAKDGKLSIEEMTGGTFSISNGGVFGSMLSTPIINPPQSAILGVHATKERPVVENGQIVIRPINYLALSYDHRIIDGREAVLSLVAMKDALEDPARLLLDL